jgi:hypothetical protein
MPPGLRRQLRSIGGGWPGGERKVVRRFGGAVIGEIEALKRRSGSLSQVRSTAERGRRPTRGGGVPDEQRVYASYTPQTTHQVFPPTPLAQLLAPNAESYNSIRLPSH